ncbi:MAG: glycosyltransferase family 4 protein [Ktedonobacteraceae bacterium]
MGRSYKVLMLVENLPVPADPRVWIEAKTLRDSGFKVCVICPKGATKYREAHTCIEGIHIYRYQLPVVSNKYTGYIAEFAVALLMTFWLSIKVLLRHGFDVIHAANPPDLFFLIGLFYRLLGKKYVFDQHDLAPEMFLVKFKGRLKFVYGLLLFFEWCSYRVAQQVIVTNLSQKWKATERGGCSPNKVIVVRNGPDLNRLKLVAAEPDLKRGCRFLLAYIGVMGIQDGVEYALQALHSLVHKRGRQDVSLVLMGDGDQLQTLKALAHELSIDSYVNFAGWTEGKDIVRYLSVTDVGISPDPQNRLNELSTMIKTMEYMAMGIPVVAFDLVETRFSTQGAALYATPNVVEDFADKIEDLLDDEELRLKLGAIGRKRIEEELSWEASKGYLLLAYQRLFPKTLKRDSATTLARLPSGQQSRKAVP